MSRKNSVVALVAAIVCVASVLSALAEEEYAGEVIKRGTYLGRVAVVNRQKVVPLSEVEKAVGSFAEFTGCNVAVAASGDGAAVVLTLIDEENVPTIMYAVEDNWATLNVGKVKEGGKAVARTRKLIVKALSLLCGGGSSSFPGNLMNAASVSELDALPEQIPADMSDRYRRYLAKLGITPKEMVSYLEACLEGWAPAPTNAAQRAVWKEVKNPASRWDKDFGGRHK